MKKTVLMIDDELDFCEMVKLSLARNNVTVDCANSLNEGMQRLKIWEPEALLLDNNLPDGLGWTQAASLQKLYPNMKIILLSAFEVPPYETTGIGMEFARVSKPIKMEELVGYLA
ncbi:response regulator [Sediminibacterium roseum]|uniref:Response regulator n=1 Tax=Sediminibacterium roseum TaxID=1978412 RepID=A0ABW9ZUR0_9BACT|nr:response regulator [Sediminibacterium roseum]NCI49969.1 response regulator [Sediminibacterium roseum]